MASWFSRINVPTLVAALAAILLDKKLGITDKIIARLPF